MTSRRLTLRKERLARLTGNDLRVVGGNGIPQRTVVCIPTEQCTGRYPSINYPCQTYYVCLETS